MSSYYPGSQKDGPSWDSFDTALEDETLDLAEYAHSSKDHILFVVDASESMHKPLPDEENAAGVIRGKSPLHQALESVCNIQRNKVTTGPSDSVGLMLYNVDDSTSGASQGKPGSGICTFQPLRQISAEDIKRIYKIVQQANAQYDEQSESDDETVEPAILREMFPPRPVSDEVNIANLLMECNHVFRDGGNKLVGNKRIFLITDDDEPQGSLGNRQPARTTYNDLLSSGIDVNTYFVGRPGKPFDPQTYWNDILQREDEQFARQIPAADDGLAELADIISELVIRQAPKRKQFSIPLKFGGRDGDIEIGISGYSLISVQNKGQPKLVHMQGETVEEVQTKTEYTAAETGGELRPQEITLAYQFGKEATIPNVLEKNYWEKEEDANGASSQMDVDGTSSQQPKVVARTRVQFTKEEINSFRTLGIEPPQIRILGFQSPDRCRFEDNVAHAYFIYPDETNYTGSTRTFTALLNSCLKLNRHALAIARMRSNSPPEFVLLVPQAETFAKNGGQEDPPGFHVIRLPFVDDIRDPPRGMTENIIANDDEVMAMEKIIRRLRFKSGKYASDAYQNPALQYHQRQLEALAFEEDFDTAMFEDLALPKYAGVHKQAGALMAEWKRLIDEDDRATEEVTVKPGTKRGAGAPAVAEIDEHAVMDVVDAFQAGKVEKCRVADLREYVKFHKLPLPDGLSLHKLLKKDLIDLVKPHLQGAGKKAKT